jgi:tetratricopeptide (TPR) repeat protein
MKTIDFSYFIERYNAGEMNTSEEIWFRKELEGNPELRAETELRRNTDAILKEQDILCLRNKLSAIEKQREVGIPSKSGKKRFQLGIAAAVTGLVLLGSIALLHTRSLSNDELVTKYAVTFEGVTSSRSLSDNGDNDYSTGLAYFNIKDFENAARFFSKVIKCDPGNMESTMYYGESYFEMKNYPAATESFDKVVANNDNLYIEDAQYFLALCYLATDNDKKAKEQLKTIRDSRSIYRKNAVAMLKAMK